MQAKIAFGAGEIEVQTLEDGKSLLIWKRPNEPDRLITMGEDGAMYEEDGRIIHLSDENGIAINDIKPVHLNLGDFPIIGQENIEIEGKVGQRYFLTEDAWIDVLQNGSNQQAIFTNLEMNIDKETNTYTVSKIGEE